LATERKKPTAGAARRKRRTPGEIRERLIRAAREEFRRCGFVGATTASIARNADVTEAQLFRCFQSKAGLFREAVFEPLNEHLAEFSAQHPSGLADAGGNREEARLYIAELQQFIGEHAQLLLALFVAQMFASGSLHGVGEIDSLRGYFERGAAAMRSRVGKDPKVDPRLLVRISFAAVLGCVTFKDWIFPPGLASDGQIRSAIIDFVMDGINVNPHPGPKETARKRKRRTSP
jgi:AcrR family transcriptional regulator